MFSNGPRYTEPLYRPPSEAHSLIFQIEEGCSHNQCTFCGMYVTKKFRLKSVEAVISEINGVPDARRGLVRRIFLADGDAVVYPFAELVQILEHMNSVFPNLDRISSYAGPQALKSKTPEEWAHLRSLKLSLLYFGLESGNNDVLSLMKKGMRAEEMLPVVQQIQQCGIDFSVMVILGGGGRKLSRIHAEETAAWVSAVNPKYLGMLTLFMRRHKNYFDAVETPTVGDLLEEAGNIISGITGKGILFRSNHISNFLLLNGVLGEDAPKLLRQVEETKTTLKKSGVYNEYPDFYREHI